MAKCNRPGCKNKATEQDCLCKTCAEGIKNETFDRSTKQGFSEYMRKYPACLEEGFGPGVTVNEAISELENMGVDFCDPA